MGLNRRFWRREGAREKIFQKNLRTYLTDRNSYYIGVAMSYVANRMSRAEFDAKIHSFVGRCRQAGLRVTPQRLAIYKELLGSDEHPSAEMLYEKLKAAWPTLSLGRPILSRAPAARGVSMPGWSIISTLSVSNVER